MWNFVLSLSHWSTAAAAVLTGIASARLWYKSAQVSSDPFMGGVQSGDELIGQGQLLTAILRDADEAAKLNRKAALLTAWSVGIGAVASILGSI
jgi:hypothetical protein